MPDQLIAAMCVVLCATIAKLLNVHFGFWGLAVPVTLFLSTGLLEVSAYRYFWGDKALAVLTAARFITFGCVYVFVATLTLCTIGATSLSPFGLGPVAVGISGLLLSCLWLWLTSFLVDEFEDEIGLIVTRRSLKPPWQ